MSGLKAKHACARPMCGNTTHGRYCDEHAHLDAQDDAQRKQSIKDYDKHRGTPTQRGYDRQWSAFSERYRRRHPICVICQRNGLIEPATQVHHVIPLDVRPDLKYDDANLMALCNACHARMHGKTGP